MANFELVAVYLTEIDVVHCSCCDGESKEVFKYYRIINAKPEDRIMSYQKYLDCCKDKMGTVVDWEAK